MPSIGTRVERLECRADGVGVRGDGSGCKLHCLRFIFEGCGLGCKVEGPGLRLKG